MENTQVGPFLILKKLGTNRRQRVYRAKQVEQNRDVALKFISIPGNTNWSSALEKIDLEVTELQKLRHPNLVRIFGAGVHEQQIFFATELVEGESLAALLSRRSKLAPDLAIEYGRQIADALGFIHDKDLIHAKLTPDKILITSDHKVKIADLRLNRAKRRRWDSSRLRELDLAAYMAPEQFTEGATAKSDIYALGVIVYEMVTGKLPYELDNMGRMAKTKMSAPPPSITRQWLDCPIWLDKIVIQMLQPNPKKRPHSAKSVFLAFEEIKKMDTSRKSTAAQMASGFNPLNAGIDKTEAKRLLNRKSGKKKSKTPLFQTVPFLFTSLLAVLALITYLLWPPGVAKQMEKYQTMVNSDQVDQWTTARNGLREIAKKESPYSLQANELYHLVQRKLMLNRVERGFSSRMQSENVQTFTQAYNLQQDDQLLAALNLYQQLVDSIPDDHSEIFIAQESAERLKVLLEEINIPQDPQQLAEWIKQFESAESASELKIAAQLLSRLIVQIAGDPKYEELVGESQVLLDQSREKLRAL